MVLHRIGTLILNGFDALYEFSKKYGPESDKGEIVQEISRRQESEPDSIDF
jgi:hypothetical protein